MTNQDDKGSEYNQMYKPGPCSAPHSASPGGGVKLLPLPMTSLEQTWPAE